MTSLLIVPSKKPRHDRARLQILLDKKMGDRAYSDRYGSKDVCTESTMLGLPRYLPDPWSGLADLN